MGDGLAHLVISSLLVSIASVVVFFEDGDDDDEVDIEKVLVKDAHIIFIPIHYHHVNLLLQPTTLEKRYALLCIDSGIMMILPILLNVMLFLMIMKE